MRFVEIDKIISKLGLEPLDYEGGWFRRTRTEVGESDRSTMTCIYALFTAKQFSALHRLDATETLFYQAGDAFEVFSISLGGTADSVAIGSEVVNGERPQSTFSAGTWFGGRPVENGKYGYSLISAVVSPGFEWSGFELGSREVLAARFPDHERMIESLTRP